MSKPSFKSVVNWRTGLWRVDTTISGFRSIDAASCFGRNGLRALIREGDNLILVKVDGGLIPLSPEQVKVSQCKMGVSSGPENYEGVTLAPHEFARTSGLGGQWTQCGYGVRAPSGEMVFQHET